MLGMSCTGTFVVDTSLFITSIFTRTDSACNVIVVLITAQLSAESPFFVYMPPIFFSILMCLSANLILTHYTGTERLWYN